MTDQQGIVVKTSIGANRDRLRATWKRGNDLCTSPEIDPQDLTPIGPGGSVQRAVIGNDHRIDADITESGEGPCAGVEASNATDGRNVHRRLARDSGETQGNPGADLLDHFAAIGIELQQTFTP